MRSDSFVLRRQNFALDEDQEAVREAFADFFTSECPPEVVRAAEDRGVDEKVWAALVEMGALSMGVPEEAGGDGAGLVALTLVAEEMGRTVAPVPLIEAAVVARLLAAVGATEILAGHHDQSVPVTLALTPLVADQGQLVPAGSLVRSVVALEGADLVLVTADVVPPRSPNQADLPVAWWDFTGLERQVLASGDTAVAAYARAQDEWKLLAAAAAVGIAHSAVRLGVEFSKTRTTMGVPIGALQSVSNALVNAEMDLQSSRHLVHKAAWYRDNEPGERDELAGYAFTTASGASSLAVINALHVHGGLGFTLEADISLYFRRAKGWAVLAGDPKAEYEKVGGLLAGVR